MALPESGKLEFYAAWAANAGQPDLAVRLRESAVRVRRMERTLDELVDEAAEDERMGKARALPEVASRAARGGRASCECTPAGVTGASPSASAFADAALRDGSPHGR